MKNIEQASRQRTRQPHNTPCGRPRLPGATRYALLAAMFAGPAQASLFQGEALDSVADTIAWVVLVIAPIVLIVGFWLIHILPEKIAEQRRHPQAKAIQTLCLLSLFFGGMLWPIAWLWAYSKPVLHKMAYGTDVHDEEHEVDLEAEAAAAEDARGEHAHIKVVDRQDTEPSGRPTRERA
jgi:CBS domain containing-hemolysin-like protein